MEWYFGVLKKYAVFNGRARRKEYWMSFLFNVIIVWAFGIIDELFGGDGGLPLLYSLAMWIPSMAVSVRRLHDTGRSGWRLLIALVPLFGWVVFLVFMLQDSQQGENRYGPNPKESTA